MPKTANKRAPVPLYYDTDVANRAQTHPKVLARWFTRVEARFFGTPIDIHPYDALMKCIAITHGEVIYCDKQMRKLTEDELFERPLTRTETQLPFLEGGKVMVTERRDMEQISRWHTLRTNAIDRLARYAKMAIDIGLEERELELAKSQAEVIRLFVDACVSDLNLTSEQRKQVAPIMRKHAGIIGQ
jgi:hypothetical protein